MMTKDDQEHRVPEAWRAAVRQIADAFAAGDFQLRHHPIEGVGPIPPATADYIQTNVAAYGEALAPLNEASWEHSVCRWMDGYWQVLVDLSTVSDPVSDLSLHAKIYEEGPFRLEVGSVHVE